jgi:GH25 family lysozyme M1 (1,4-beta-N-acetylmuramidase)
MDGTVRSWVRGDVISVVLRDDLTDERYDVPLTLETEVPADWTAADVRQGERAQRVPVTRDGGRSSVLYEAVPNGEDVQIARVERR